MSTKTPIAKFPKFRAVGLVLVLSIFLLHTAQSQTKSDTHVQLGLGLPELFHVGVEGSLDNTRMGFGLGTWPLASGGETFFTATGYLLFEAGGTSDMSNFKPWFLKTGFTYFRNELPAFIDHFLYFNLRLGRDFYLGPRSGIRLDFGAAFEAMDRRIRKEPATGWGIDIDFPVLPGIGLSYFHKINR